MISAHLWLRSWNWRLEKTCKKPEALLMKEFLKSFDLIYNEGGFIDIEQNHKR